MSNNLTLPDSPNLPYYVATHRSRSVAIKRDVDYQTTIKLVQKSMAKLRGVDAQDILIFTTLADYGGALVQISEEIWPDVVSHLRIVEITIEGEDPAASDPADVRTGNLIWTPQYEGSAMTAAGTNRADQDSHVQTGSSQTVGRSASPSSSSHGSISITVRTPSHRLLRLNDLRSSITFKDVKAFIENEYGVPAALQRLDLLGKPLDNSKTLAMSDITFSTIVDLTLRTRQSVTYVIPGSDPYSALATYQNIKVQLSLNQTWELAALGLSSEASPKDYVQSASWIVDVSRDGTLIEHGSSIELSCIFWDGLAQSTQPAKPAQSLSPSQPAELPSADGSKFTPLLDPKNSAAVPFNAVDSYIQNLFYYLGFNDPLRERLIQFTPHLKQKPHEYLALRFIPQAECETIAPLSVSPPTDYVTRILVLYKGLSASAAQTWDTTRPNYAQGASIWKQILKVKPFGQNVTGGCLNVIEISWMEVP